jgi:hypothetical protein
MSVLLVIESRHSLCEGANHTIIQHKATVYNYRNASTYCRQDPRKWYWLLPSHLGNQHCHVEDVAIACLRFSFLLCKLVATHNDRHSNRFRDPYQLCLQHNLEKSLGPLDSLEPRYFEDQQCEGHVIRHISNSTPPASHMAPHQRAVDTQPHPFPAPHSSPRSSQLNTEFEQILATIAPSRVLT